MTMSNVAETAHAAFRSRQWAECYALLREADKDEALEAEDLDLLAEVSFLIGRDDESAETRVRAHEAFLRQGAVDRAVRCAFWLAFGYFRRGERERGGGWLARARRLVEERGLECAECGYLLLPEAIGAITGGDAERGDALFARAASYGERFGDQDLVTLARTGRGRALIRLRMYDEGVALLDESMADVEAGVVSARVAGDVYCTVIEGCHEIFDLHRAGVWTEALSDWCASQPDLVPYRGQCQVRRSEVMQFHGAWPEAVEEARQACERLAGPPAENAAGEAYYQKGELHRLLGEFDEAEEAYHTSARWIRRARPGLALLRLAQGRTDAAERAIARAIDEADEATRPRALAAAVEIALAAGDVEGARASADQLEASAADNPVPYLQAAATGARGAVLLAEGDAPAAHAALRAAWQQWSALEAPYETARVRMRLGAAGRAMGDAEGSVLDFEAARMAFRELGALPALAELEALEVATGSEEAHHGLSERELEVLRLVAAGGANKQIAGALFISERTVERHVSNIFNKLGVSSRTGAAAYAYEHGLV